MVPPGSEALPPDQIVRRLEALLPCESVSEDYVRLRIAVLRAQAATLDALRAAAENEDRDDSCRAGHRPEVGRGPCRHIVPAPLSPHSRFSAPLFEAIVTACRQHGETGEELSRLELAVQSRPELLDDLTRAATPAPDEESLNSLAGRLQVSAPLLLLVGRLLAAPFLACAARTAQPPEHTLPDSEGFCPVCGSTPALASLGAEDGRRLLHCSLCGWSWPFARLVCPFCGNRDQPSLTRLAIDGQEARWIEACERCKSYLKTVDLRQRAEPEPFSPLVEEVAGLYLDLVAEREGYAGKPPYAAVG